MKKEDIDWLKIKGHVFDTENESTGGSSWLYVPIPRSLTALIDAHIKKHPELGCRSRAEFVRRIISEELRKQ